VSPPLAHGVGARHILTIARNPAGTPLVSDEFAKATLASRADLMCYANADIMFMPDLTDGLGRMRAQRFMLCGQRWDIVHLRGFLRTVLHV